MATAAATPAQGSFYGPVSQDWISRCHQPRRGFVLRRFRRRMSRFGAPARAPLSGRFRLGGGGVSGSSLGGSADGGWASLRRLPVRRAPFADLAPRPRRAGDGSTLRPRPRPRRWRRLARHGNRPDAPRRHRRPAPAGSPPRFRWRPVSRPHRPRMGQARDLGHCRFPVSPAPLPRPRLPAALATISKGRRPRVGRSSAPRLLRDEFGVCRRAARGGAAMPVGIAAASGVSLAARRRGISAAGSATSALPAVDGARPRSSSCRRRRRRRRRARPRSSSASGSGRSTRRPRPFRRRPPRLRRRRFPVIGSAEPVLPPGFAGPKARNRSSRKAGGISVSSRAISTWMP